MYNQHLEELHLTQYGTDDFQVEDNPIWKKQREEYGFDERETFNMDVTFAEWLYSHLMRYKELDNSNLHLTFTVFNNEHFTKESAIEEILSTCKEYLQLDYPERDEEIDSLVDATHIWAEILPVMWIHKPAKTDFKEEKEKYGFDSREVAFLYRSFIQWLQRHVALYNVVNNVDTSYNSYNLEECDLGTKTFQECLDYILSSCEKLTNYLKEEKESHSFSLLLTTTTQVWAEILPDMWW